MGLNPDNHSNRVFINIVGGKFAKRVPEGTIGATERTIENKRDGSTKVVWEIIYKDIDAMIDSIEIDETGEYGDQLKINMSDIGDKFTISLPLMGREAKSFLCCLPNIDLQQMVTLMPYNFDGNDGKKVIGMNTYQGGKEKANKVEWFYTKENLPQGTEGMDKDEFKLLMQQQTIFLKKKTKQFIADHNFAARTNGTVAQATTVRNVFAEANKARNKDEVGFPSEPPPSEPTDDLPW